jgi:hypothetical protein
MSTYQSLEPMSIKIQYTSIDGDLKIDTDYSVTFLGEGIIECVEIEYEEDEDEDEDEN